MKILAINGSRTGTKGYTHFLIEKLFTGANAKGVAMDKSALVTVLSEIFIIPTYAITRLY